MQLPAELVAKCRSRDMLAVATVVYGTVPYIEGREPFVCWRSKAWIMEAAKVSAKAVERASAWLVARGYVARPRRGRNHSDWLLLALPKEGYRSVGPPPAGEPTNARTPVSEPADARTPAGAHADARTRVSPSHGHACRGGTDTDGGHIGDLRGQEGTIGNRGSEVPKSRRPKGFDPTPTERRQLGAILAALREARSAAEMHVPGKPYRVGPTHARPFLRRLRELVIDGEDDPVALLVAVVQAKVAEHAAHNDPKFRSGRYATGTTICRDEWWSGNLEAGRAWLDGERPRPRQQRSKSGAHVPRGGVTL